MTLHIMESPISILTGLLDEKRIAYNEIHLPFLIMSDIPDNGFRSHLYGKSTKINELFPDHIQYDDPCETYIITDVYQCSYFLFPLREPDLCGLIGPFIFGHLSNTDMKQFRKNSRLSSKDYANYQQYMASVPKIYDSALFESILKTFCGMYYGKDHYTIKVWATSVTQTSLTEPETERFTYEEIELRYANEKLLIKAISEGNYDRINSLLSMLSVHGIESRTGNFFRDSKNFCIVLNTICRIGASQGGADPSRIDALSREYSIRIEDSATIDDLKHLSDEMIRSYCRIVSNDPSPGNAQVNRALTYICNHYREQLSLADASRDLGIAKTYLAGIFKKETGKSFNEYVSDYRLSIGTELLISTDLTIADIASRCGIPDPNYFSRQFRRKYQMSPAMYRNTERTRRLKEK